MKRILLLAALLVPLVAGAHEVLTSKLRVTLSGDSTWTIPFETSEPLTGDLSHINRVIFAQHGAGNNASMYQTVENYKDDSTLVVGWQLLQIADLLEGLDGYTSAEEDSTLYWPTAGYGWGTFVEDARTGYMSSAAVVDSACVLVAQYLPNPDVAVFLGFSGGGNFTSRWSTIYTLNTYFPNSAQAYFSIAGGTPLYLTGARYDHDDGTFTWPDTSGGACPTYNSWPLGLGNAEVYFPEDSTYYANKLRTQYTVHICGSSDGSESDPSCGSGYFGTGRPERIKIHWQHLRDVFTSAGQSATDFQKYHKFMWVPNVSHSLGGILENQQAHYLVFDWVPRDDNFMYVKAVTPLDTVSTLDGWNAITGWEKAAVTGLWLGREYGFKFLSGAGLDTSASNFGDAEKRSGVADGLFYSWSYDGNDSYYMTNAATVTALQWDEGTVVETLFRLDTGKESGALYTPDNSERLFIDSVSVAETNPSVLLNDGVGNNITTITGQAVDDGNWHLLTVLVSSDTTVMWLDGISYKQQAHGLTAPLNDGSPIGTIPLGARVSNGSDGLVGQIAFVAQYTLNAALTPTGSDTLREALSRTWANTHAWYDNTGFFGSPQAALDYAAANFDGARTEFDTIYLQDGTYSQKYVGIADSIAITGESVTGTVFDATALDSLDAVWQGPAGTAPWTIKKMTIQNVPSGAIGGYYRTSGVMSNVLFKDNVGASYYVQLVSGAALYIDHCTFTDNVNGVVVASTNAGNVEVSNSVLVNGSSGLVNNDLSGTFLNTFNLFYNNSVDDYSGTWTTTGAVTGTDPGFKDAAGGDYRILSSIDKGDDGLPRGAIGTAYSAGGGVVLWRFFFFD